VWIIPLSFGPSIVLVDADYLFHISGWPCNIEGEYLALDASTKGLQTPGRPPPEWCGDDDWSPFANKAAFRAAELLFVDNQMSQLTSIYCKKKKKRRLSGGPGDPGHMQ
jgi:hypothetical protein